MPLTERGCVFFNDTATTELSTLSLRDAVPISSIRPHSPSAIATAASALPSSPRSPAHATARGPSRDRKSTRLNSSHANISYAVFCLKKKTHLGKLPPRSTKPHSAHPP